MRIRAPRPELPVQGLAPRPAPARLVLIRHGQSTWNSEHRIQGQLDPPLSAEGRRQAELLADRLAGRRLAGFYTSDPWRGPEAAQILGLNAGAQARPVRGPRGQRGGGSCRGGRGGDREVRRCGMNRDAEEWAGRLARLASPAPLLQSWRWGQVQRKVGWSTDYVELGGMMANVQLRKVGPATEAYVPRGPLPARPEAIDLLASWPPTPRVPPPAVQPPAP